VGETKLVVTGSILVAGGGATFGPGVGAGFGIVWDTEGGIALLLSEDAAFITNASLEAGLWFSTRRRTSGVICLAREGSPASAGVKVPAPGLPWVDPPTTNPTLSSLAPVVGRAPLDASGGVTFTQGVDLGPSFSDIWRAMVRFPQDLALHGFPR